MNYYLLFYHVIDDYVAKRAPYRDEHLRMVFEAHARGELVMAGALADPVDTALLIFRSENTAIVEEFIRKDPYVRNGLIARWEIRPWTVVTA